MCLAARCDNYLETVDCVVPFILGKINGKNGRTAAVVRASPKLTEYIVNVQSSLHENVVFSVCARMDNAAYIIFIMWNFISGLDTWYYFRFNVSYGVAVKVRSHQIEFQVIF